MANKDHSSGFSTLIILIIILVVAIIGLCGWFLYTNAGEDKSLKISPTPMSPSKENPAKPQLDPSEGGKYLVIKEWGVRAAIESHFQNKITYKISQAIDPDTGLELENATIYVSRASLDENSCAILETNLGPSTPTTIQYIRSDSSLPLNITRYSKGVFQDYILKTDGYDYHLNFITPDCIGTDDNLTSIHQLQTDLGKLIKTQ